METEQTDIKAKIAELRARYARLKNICGASHISRETIAEYARELQALEAKLN